MYLRGMGLGGGFSGPVRNPDQNAGILNEQQKDDREQAHKEHQADEVHPTWWQRLRSRRRHRTSGRED
jgi:hypothetical protein